MTRLLGLVEILALRVLPRGAARRRVLRWVDRQHRRVLRQPPG
jgi:hypothetical protein